MLTNECVEPGERFTITSDINPIDGIICEAVRTETNDPSSGYKYKVAVQFKDIKAKQQDKIYGYIIAQQLEKRRQLNEKRPLFNPQD